MKFALLYSFRRILRKKSKILLMGFFLSLGFWGWLLSESSQTSIKNNLANNAKQVLSSDISISARRELTPQEIEGMRTTLSGKADVIKGYEFFAMLTSSTDTRLVLVRVVEDFYPFYGQLVLSPESSAPNLKGQNLWAYEEFKTLFGIGLDEKVKLGDLEFRVSAFVKEDKTQTFRLASLAPRVFIHMDDLKKTGLIQFGSTFTTTFFIKTYRESEVKSLTEKLKKTLQDPAIDITSFQSLPDDESSPSQRLADFLGLTSLVSLLFSALSLFYLIQIL